MRPRPIQLHVTAIPPLTSCADGGGSGRRVREQILAAEEDREGAYYGLGRPHTRKRIKCIFGRTETHSTLLKTERSSLRRGKQSPSYSHGDTVNDLFYSTFFLLRKSRLSIHISPREKQFAQATRCRSAALTATTSNTPMRNASSLYEHGA